MKLITAGAGAVIITLDKEFNLGCEEELFKLVNSFSPHNIQNILLDFNQVDKLDNTGLNVLVKLYVQSNKSHQTLIAFGVMERYREVFMLCGLDKAYRIFVSLAEVVKTVKLKDKDLVKRYEENPIHVNECTGPEFACWSPYTPNLKVVKVPHGAINLNMNGRHPAGPIQGFGQLWEKIYSIDLSDSKLSPEEIISVLKSHFADFQPPENRFYPSELGFRPGELVIINADTPGGMVATGVMILYEGQDTFTFITPQGHPESGWVTFRSFKENGKTIMEIRGFARASDPVYEIAFRIVGSGLQQNIWSYLLKELANNVGSTSQVSITKRCIDTSLQWSHFGNVFWNAQIFSMLYRLAHPCKKRQGDR